MLKAIFTRKNFIVIALACLYSFLMVFVGLCLDNSSTVLSPKNPINLLAISIGLPAVSPNINGKITLFLTGVFFAVFVTAVIYQKRVAVVAGRKPFSPKMIGAYAITAFVCLAFSVGVGILIQSPISKENLTILLRYLGNSILLSALIYIVLFLGIGSIVMLVINFLLVDKPFKFFDAKDEPVFDDDDVHDVSGSFDVDATAQSGPVAGGGGIGGGTGDGEGGVGAGGQTMVLGDREKVFPELSSIDEKFDGFDAVPVESDRVTLQEIATGFRNFLARNYQLYFDIDTIRFFVSGFGASHFEILEGLSGTGKSSLPRYFAKYVSGNVLFMPVQATWRDKTSILGFFNEFSQTYKETEFLTRLYESAYNTDEINIYVLDEMNISRVEYYFADLLSVLEYPVEDWKLKIMNVPHTFVPPIKLEDGYVRIPENSYFVGTANRDDSTFTITDKVYDRAITLDFEVRNQPFTVNEEAPAIRLSGSYFRHLLNGAIQNGTGLNDDDRAKLNQVLSFVYDKFDLAIGNRITNQIYNIVPIFVECGGTKEDAIDFMLCKKLFAKLEGRFEEYVKGALTETLTLIQSVYGNGVLKRSEKVIEKIRRSL